MPTSDEMRLPALVPKDHPALHTPAQPFDFQNPLIPGLDGPVTAAWLADALKEAVIEYKSIGVAAPQFGLPVRVFAFGDPGNHESIAVAFNPQILDTFGGLVKLEEGCLTFPGLFVKITRPAGIRVRYTTAAGVTDTIKLSGMTARIVQHELDHLDGIVFTARATNFDLVRARQQQKILLRRLKAQGRSLR